MKHRAAADTSDMVKMSKTALQKEQLARRDIAEFDYSLMTCMLIDACIASGAPAGLTEFEIADFIGDKLSQLGATPMRPLQLCSVVSNLAERGYLISNAGRFVLSDKGKDLLQFKLPFSPDKIAAIIEDAKLLKEEP